MNQIEKTNQPTDAPKHVDPDELARSVYGDEQEMHIVRYWRHVLGTITGWRVRTVCGVYFLLNDPNANRYPVEHRRALQPCAKCLAGFKRYGR